MFMFTRNGNLQNADFLYAFFLGIILLFLNFIISNRLTILFESLFLSSSRGFRNFLGIAIPSVFCALIAVLLFRTIGRKRITLLAYCIALVIMVIFTLGMVFMYDREVVVELLPAFLGIFIAPNLAGILAAALLYRKWRNQNPDPIWEEEMELENRTD